VVDHRPDFQNFVPDQVPHFVHRNNGFVSLDFTFYNLKKWDRSGTKPSTNEKGSQTYRLEPL
jgi:hypothetical protein